MSDSLNQLQIIYFLAVSFVDNLYYLFILSVKSFLWISLDLSRYHQICVGRTYLTEDFKLCVLKNKTIENVLCWPSSMICKLNQRMYNRKLKMSQTYLKILIVPSSCSSYWYLCVILFMIYLICLSQMSKSLIQLKSVCKWYETLMSWKLFLITINAISVVILE